MRHRSLERAAAAGVALSLLAATVAFADTVHADADTVTAGAQGTRDLGTAAPGAVLEVLIDFELKCSGLQHADVGQSVVVTVDQVTALDASLVAMDPVALGPVPAGWAADGEGCTGTEVPIVATGTMHVTAPATTGSYAFTVLFNKAPSPAGLNDTDAAIPTTAADFTLTVVGPTNTPPSLALPGDMTVVADGPDGWTASYVVTATDAEDDPDPTPTCLPAIGDVLPLGTTTVECSVTDAGGLTASGSFAVTVEAEPTEPEPEPEPAAVATTAVFGAPVKADGLDGRAGRTIPLKVRLAAGDVPVGEGSLSLVVTSCAGGDPVGQLEMEWRSGSERWFGLLRTRGLEAGCYAVRALHDGVDVGGFELRLFDMRAEVAKEKAGAAKAAAADRKAAAVDRKAAADLAKEKAKPAGQGGSGKGRP